MCAPATWWLAGLVGEDPIQAFWQLFVQLRPQDGCEYTLIEPAENGTLRRGLLRQFGLQDDIPQPYRTAVEELIQAAYA